MTKTEIFETVDLVRDTLISAHVKLNEALDQVEKLRQRIVEDLQREPEDGKP